MKKYHLGQEILKEVMAKYSAVSDFAEDLGESSSVVYEIFGKTSIDTDLLLKVSKLLKRNFMHELSEKYLNGEVANGQTSGGCITHLQPEDKLHIFSPRETLDVVEEYLSLPWSKPLVVFYNHECDNPHLYNVVLELAEGILGKGMVKGMLLEEGNLQSFKSAIPSYSVMPEKAFVLLCNEGSNYRLKGFIDYELSIAQKLSEESRKHVIVMMHDPIHLDIERMLDSISLISYAYWTFNSCNENAHILISDDDNNIFTFNNELYNAIQGEGYMDKIHDCISRGGSTEEVNGMLAEAKQILRTYKDEVLGEEDYKDGYHVEVHQVSTIQPTLSDIEEDSIGRALTGIESYAHVLTHLRYRIVEETGEILEFEPISFDQAMDMQLYPRSQNNKTNQ